MVSVQLMHVKKLGRCRWQCCDSFWRSGLKQIHTCTAATSRAASPCGHLLQCSRLWSSGWRPVLQLRSCAHERHVNEVSDLMQQASRVSRKAEQVLHSFLGFEPNARFDTRKKLVRRGVNFEQLPPTCPFVWRSTACSRWSEACLVSR